jgi:DNA-binding response OmpR family regulator
MISVSPVRLRSYAADELFVWGLMKMLSERVLLVEDDRELAAELVEGAALEGVEVDAVHTAAEAVRALSEGKHYDLLATDIVLGEITGLELLRKLAIVSPDRRMPAVVLSGHYTTEHVLSALRLGVVDFLPKPVLASEFVDAIRRAKPVEKDAAQAMALMPEGAAKLLMKARRKREEVFGGDFFDDPTWHMLLDLHSSSAAGREVTVSDLCIGSGASNTTALRRLDVLVRQGLAERVPDNRDRRRILVRQTQAARLSMVDFLDWFRRSAAQTQPNRN